MRKFSKEKKRRARVIAFSFFRSDREVLPALSPSSAHRHNHTTTPTTNNDDDTNKKDPSQSTETLCFLSLLVSALTRFHINYLPTYIHTYVRP